MSEIITVGLDLAKNVYQVHGAYGALRALLRKKLRRGQVLEFFSQLPGCVVAMEACGGAHFWGREIGKLRPPWPIRSANQVRLTSGPFAKFVGTIESIAPGRRVWVLMKIMGGETRVAVGSVQLRQV
jgi:hypothetical protein